MKPSTIWNDGLFCFDAQVVITAVSKALLLPLCCREVTAEKNDDDRDMCYEYTNRGEPIDSCRQESRHFI